jgi:hypothetical protein
MEASRCRRLTERGAASPARAIGYGGEEHFRRQGAHRITALVGYEDEVASAFWESAGYPRDRQIGRRVRNL